MARASEGSDHQLAQYKSSEFLDSQDGPGTISQPSDDSPRQAAGEVPSGCSIKVCMNSYQSSDLQGSGYVRHSNRPIFKTFFCKTACYHMPQLGIVTHGSQPSNHALVSATKAVLRQSLTESGQLVNAGSHFCALWHHAHSTSSRVLRSVDLQGQCVSVCLHPLHPVPHHPQSPAWRSRAVYHSTARHITARHGTAQHSTAQHSTAWQSTASSAQRSSAQLSCRWLHLVGKVQAVTWVHSPAGNGIPC